MLILKRVMFFSPMLLIMITANVMDSWLLRGIAFMVGLLCAFLYPKFFTKKEIDDLGASLREGFVKGVDVALDPKGEVLSPLKKNVANKLSGFIENNRDLNVVDQLSELEKMKSSGTLTAEEFTNAKEKILKEKRVA